MYFTLRKILAKEFYSVKSAYRLCVEDLVDITHLHRPGFYTSIWKLKVPPKIKNLIWRICEVFCPLEFDGKIKGFNARPIVLAVSIMMKILNMFSFIAHLFFRSGIKLGYSK